MFSKGRDYRVAYIEDYVTNINIAMMQCMHILHKEIESEKKRIQEISKQEARGDKQIESDTFNSMWDYSSCGVLDNYLDYIVKANFCFIYNEYEKLLEYIILNYQIPEVRRNNGDSIAKNRILSIQKYLKIELFDPIIETLLKKVDDEYRKIRIYLTHNEMKNFGEITFFLQGKSGIDIIGDKIFFRNDEYVTSFSSDVNQILRTLVNEVDKKSKN